MRMIGIDENQNIVYEGVASVGYPISPSPTIVAARVVSALGEGVLGESISDLRSIPLLFREDVFDPVARIRRGRFYINNPSQPIRWRVFSYPTGAFAPADLVTFHAHRLSVELRKLVADQAIIVLGNSVSFTIWTVVSIESTVTHEEVAILRSREMFGALPKMLPANIPDVSRDQVFKKATELAAEIHRAGAESVVDRSRETITAALSAHLQEAYGKPPGKDIGVLIASLEQELTKKPETANASELVIGASKVVKRLHARGKNAEQERRPLRTVTEKDAELAVACVGAVLCDLRFAEWS